MVENYPSLAKNGNTYIVTKYSQQLLKQIGGKQKIHECQTIFYEHFKKDSHIIQFMENPNEPHSERLADWIIEKMTGQKDWSSKLDSREPDQPYDRQSAHYKAWNSFKRKPNIKGEHFKLQDTRVWMRLQFLAARQVGLDQIPAFWHWYLQFIGHFIAVYERQAPPYVLESSEWSLDPQNYISYVNNKYKMTDLII